MQNKYFGFYRARCQEVDIPDFKNYGAVRVFIPDVMTELDPEFDETTTGIIAFPANNPLGGRNDESPGSYGVGTVYVPPKGSWVWVFFEGGSIEKPYYCFSLDIKNTMLPPENRLKEDGTEISEPHKVYTVIRTHDGRSIIISDDEGVQRIEITGKKRQLDTTSPTGDLASTYTINNNQTTLLLDERDGKEKLLIKSHKGDFLNLNITDQQLHCFFQDDIHIKSGGSIYFEAAEDINILSNKKLFVESKDEMNILSGKHLNQQSVESMNIKSGDTLNVESISHSNLKSGGNIISQSSGLTSFKSGTTLSVQSENSMNIKSGEKINCQSSDDINLKAGGKISGTASSNIELKGNNVNIKGQIKSSLSGGSVSVKGSTKASVSAPVLALSGAPGSNLALQSTGNIDLISNGGDVNVISETGKVNFKSTGDLNFKAGGEVKMEGSAINAKGTLKATAVSTLSLATTAATCASGYPSTPGSGGQSPSSASDPTNGPPEAPEEPDEPTEAIDASPAEDAVAATESAPSTPSNPIGNRN